MNSGTSDTRVLRVVTYVTSAVNLLLALNYFPLVPLLSWLSYGHAPRATAWIPDALMLVILPAGYFVYWHYWFLAAVPAAMSSLLLFRRTRNRRMRQLALLNVGAAILYWVVRIALSALGIQPDIV
jgi:hypothetical protein